MSVNGNVAGPVTNSYEELRRRVRQRLSAADVDRERNGEEVRRIIQAVVDAYQRDANAGVAGQPLRNPAEMTGRLARSVLGFGPLDPFVNTTDPPVEVEVRGGDVTYKDDRGAWHSVTEASTEEENRSAIDRLLQPVGRALTEATPIVSTQVLDRRVRLTASIPPISDVLEASLRFYRVHVATSLFDLVPAPRDTLSPPAANWCWALMRHPQIGVLVSGRPQSGKTTFLNALLQAVPPSHKVCCCEDTRELRAPLMHASYRQTKPRSGLSDDEVEVTLRRLIELTLRSSPERIVVGEVRGQEAAELTRASNAGSALLCTLHAHSAQDALDALANAALLGDHRMPPETVRSIFSRTIDVVVHLDSEDVELRGGADDRPVRRQVMEIAAVSPLQGSEHRFTVVPVFTRKRIGGPLVWTHNPLPGQLEFKVDQVLHRYGTTSQAVLAGREVINR